MKQTKQSKPKKTIAAKKEGLPVAKKEVAVKAVAVQEPKALQEFEAGSAFDPAAWGAAPISSKDVIIPRILLAQPMSDSVTNGDAKFGDLLESLSSTTLAGFDKALAVVPFLLRKVWVEYDVTAGTDIKNKKFLRVTPITPNNENLPYQDEEKNENTNGMRKVLRDYVLEFFVLPVDDLIAGTAIPHILSFRRSSMQAGKKIATQMYMKNINAGLSPAAVQMIVIPKKESNDQGTFAVMDVTIGEPARHEWIEKAFYWMKLVNSGKAKVDENSYDADAVGGTSDMPAAENAGKF